MNFQACRKTGFFCALKRHKKCTAGKIMPRRNLQSRWSRAAVICGQGTLDHCVKFHINTQSGGFFCAFFRGDFHLKTHFLSFIRPAWNESKPLKSPFFITFTDFEGDLTRFQIPLKCKVEFTKLYTTHWGFQRTSVLTKETKSVVSPSFPEYLCGIYPRSMLPADGFPYVIMMFGNHISKRRAYTIYNI